MEAANASPEPSLLPYVNSHTEGIHIQFPLSVHSNAFSGTAGSERYPITFQRDACVTISGRHKLLDVICICQPDIYAIEPSVLHPLTNPDLENIWQQTWMQLNKMDADAKPFILPCQIGKKGELVQLRPLFYCSHKDRYGHPLCPTCGGPLALCRDDDLLKSAGLGTYSGSLDRHLYCNNCHQKEALAPFYARSLKETSSTKVQDSDALMEAFGRLLAQSHLSDQLPCIGCDETANCYGPETLVLKRMQPMQFYPFHMLIQRACTLNAVEFIALLSGADPKELEHLSLCGSDMFPKDRFNKVLPRLTRGAGYMFGRDDRRFLEILYLKLTFLQELFALARLQAFTTANRISLEDIGVEIPFSGSKLPGFWHFSLKLINPIGRPNRHPPGSKLPHFLLHEFLGLAWFYVLLVNAEQPIASVVNAIQAGTAPVLCEDADPGEVLGHPVLNPGNIFRDPQVLTPDPEYLALWIEALKQGCALVRCGQRNDGESSLRPFDRQLEQLRARVHGTLFTAPPGGIQLSDTRREDSNARIAAILKGILARWPQTASPPSHAGVSDQLPPVDASHPVRVNKDGDYGQTVILSEEDLLAQVNETRPGEAYADLGETVIISPRGHVPEKDVFNDLEETVAAPPQPAPPADTKLNEAVGLNPVQTPSEQNDLEKTVIISAPGQPAMPQAPESLPDEDKISGGQSALPEGELEKTVIIQRMKGHNRKPKP